DHRLLDQPRRIFADRDAAPGGGEQHHAARLAELEGRLRVVVDEHLLDRRRARPVLAEHGLKPVVELYQARGERHLGVGPDLAVGDMAQAIALRPDHAPACASKAGIEAEDDHAEYSSPGRGGGPCEAWWRGASAASMEPRGPAPLLLLVPLPPPRGRAGRVAPYFRAGPRASPRRGGLRLPLPE